MKIEVGENHEIVLKEVFSGVLLESINKEQIGVCMRDSGFEVTYNGDVYSFQQGTVTNLTEDALKRELMNPNINVHDSNQSKKSHLVEGMQKLVEKYEKENLLHRIKQINDSNKPKDQSGI